MSIQTCKVHSDAITPGLCCVCLIKERNSLQVENQRLKEAIEEVIKAPHFRHVPNWVVIKLEKALKGE